MFTKILLAKVSLLAKLKVIGVRKHTVPMGECGKDRDGINNYEQIMDLPHLVTCLQWVALQFSLHAIYFTNRIPQYSVALELLTAGVRKEL